MNRSFSLIAACALAFIASKTILATQVPTDKAAEYLNVKLTVSNLTKSDLQAWTEAELRPVGSSSASEKEFYHRDAINLAPGESKFFSLFEFKHRMASRKIIKNFRLLVSRDGNTLEKEIKEITVTQVLSSYPHLNEASPTYVQNLNFAVSEEGTTLIINEQK